jgi:hypothetical protein
MEFCERYTTHMERVGKRTLIIGAIVLIATGAAVWYFTSRTPIPAYLVPTAQEREVMEHAIESYEQVEMVPVNELGDLDAIEELFSQAELQDPIAGSQHRSGMPTAEIEFAKARLRSVLARFVRFRLLPDERYSDEQNLNRYIAWRHERGDELYEIDAEGMYLGEVYKGYTGEPIPPNSSKESVFRRVYEKMEQNKSESNTPVAIAGGPEAQLFVAWWYHPHIGPHHPDFAHPLGGDGWVENHTAGAMSWFRHRLGDPDITKSMRVYLRAYAGVVVEFADGSRYPIVLNLRWESADKQWIIENLIYANTDRQKIEAMIF